MKKAFIGLLFAAIGVNEIEASENNRNTIVIFESKSGHTKQYAEWISEELGCKCVSRKEISLKEIKEYENVIYGGWIMADHISGFEKVSKQINPTVVFAVGSCPAYEEVIDEIKRVNGISIPFFYLQGGMKKDRLGFLQKKMIGLVVSQIKKKENKSRKEEFMAEYLGKDFDFSGKDQIASLVQYVKEQQ